jgi:hypothetical protein
VNLALKWSELTLVVAEACARKRKTQGRKTSPAWRWLVLLVLTWSMLMLVVVVENARRSPV